jgi:hypothetical protein
MLESTKGTDQALMAAIVASIRLMLPDGARAQNAKKTHTETVVLRVSFLEAFIQDGNLASLGDFH